MLLLIGLAVALALIVPVGAVLATYAVRRYIASAKCAEARTQVSAIARSAANAYEREKVSGEKSSSQVRSLCGSSTAVPPSPAAVKGTKYSSTESDWGGDGTTGWKCLKFSMSQPQYFQYQYVATATGFEVIARGDLNGDGVLSTYTLVGTIANDRVTISPTISEIDPEE